MAADSAIRSPDLDGLERERIERKRKRERKKRRDERVPSDISVCFSRVVQRRILRYIYAASPREYIAFARGYAVAIISRRSSERSPFVRESRHDDDNGDDARTYVRTSDAEKSRLPSRKYVSRARKFVPRARACGTHALRRAAPRGSDLM